MKERLVLKKSVKKALWTTIILLLTLIITKKNPQLKEKIEEIVYEKNLPMISLRKQYDKYFSWNKKQDTLSVSKEIIPTKKEETTDAGVKLTVEKNQTIQNLESGMVILVDNNSIVIEQIDGVTATYNNIENKNLKIYDYIEKGEILGSASQEEIMISFTKEGVYYDYKHYL